MHDRPYASELLAAVADFLQEDVLPVVPESMRFHIRVAANSCRIVSREVDATPEDVAAAVSSLTAFVARGDDGRWRARPGGEDAGAVGDDLPAIGADDVREMQRELARALRAGELDHRLAEVSSGLRALIAEKLRVANPDYLASEGEG